jgi:motility quorum-sensing regulator / GCU-specific mRNA interferase toxin
MKKRRPHHALEQVHLLTNDPKKIQFTRSALDGGIDLGLDLQMMRSIVMGLRMSDFYKSMTAHASSKVWQDVYRPHFRGTSLYLKLTVTAEDELLIVSFKRR